MWRRSADRRMHATHKMRFVNSAAPRRHDAFNVAFVWLTASQQGVSTFSWQVMSSWGQKHPPTGISNSVSLILNTCSDVFRFRAAFTTRHLSYVLMNDHAVTKHWTVGATLVDKSSILSFQGVESWITVNWSDFLNLSDFTADCSSPIIVFQNLLRLIKAQKVIPKYDRIIDTVVFSQIHHCTISCCQCWP